ncbi:MAG: tRNA pseudouridine(38-40) synthase TruA [Bacteroidales bacterium]|nr:tRNA pseudouridine(38-40) synthase TruA [Bacteroidales bacterium]
MRFSIRLSYNGAPFSGWQVQQNGITVQQCLEHALSTLLKGEVTVTGAGRTDSGVNAVGYVAHFDAPEGTASFPERFIYKLNAILPRSVTVHEVVPADSAFHARFDARKRSYAYFIHRKKDPFMDSFSFLHTFPTDVDAMNRAAESLLGTHDFSCFEKTGGSNKTSVCTVTEARWESYVPDHVRLMGFPAEEGDYLVFRISADRFLRNMVRAIVGTLLEVGRGRRSVESVAALLDGGATRSDAGESVPGNALFLSGVEY